MLVVFICVTIYSKHSVNPVSTFKGIQRLWSFLRKSRSISKKLVQVWRYFRRFVGDVWRQVRPPLLPSKLAIALPRISHNLVAGTLEKSPIARQIRQHHREPYDLRRLRSIGILSRMHWGCRSWCQQFNCATRNGNKCATFSGHLKDVFQV